jgi:histidyl-tRNA synthetase
MSEKTKISTESYKGVRDFYPEDFFIQNYIFEVWKKTAQSFGYLQYDASILESAELYKAKSGEEIVNEQTYTFVDRGDREVTLRPEMTPTVARMVAAKERELVLPLRWFSIPNLFRYEKPQRGRLREHWQLNVDLFGIDSSLGDIEVINIAYQIMKNFGAKDEDFIIKINDRRLIKQLYEKFSLNEENSYKLSKLIDKKDKISESAFMEACTEILGDKALDFVTLLESHEKLLDYLGENAVTKELVDTIEQLLKVGVKNIYFDPTLMRGFDYYTGVVFEVFDTDPENNRSVFGGGRYDDLMDIFGARKVPSVGFGAGDVTARDFLEKHNLLPVFKPETKVYLCTTNNDFKKDAILLSQKMREFGINTAVDLTDKKLGDQIKNADRNKIPYIICIGEDEIKTGTYNLKNLSSGEEKKVKLEEIVSVI